MTTTIDSLAADDPPAGDDHHHHQAPDATGDLAHSAQALAGRPLVAVERLAEHPGNVRRDLSLDDEFLASIAELGILTPLRVTPDRDGEYRIIEGHRRLAAALQLGLAEVPYDLAAEREGDEAGQFLDMYATNHHRKNLTPLEEADALFSANAAGASKTRIRKASGLSKEDVAAALAAGQMGGDAREMAQAFGYALTLPQLALLAEFDGDEEAIGRLTSAFCDGRSGEHAAEEIRQKRAEAVEHERIAAQLVADGYAVTKLLPPGARMLNMLTQDGLELTPEAHGSCPGRGIYFWEYYPLEPRHYCVDPEANGHADRYQPTPLPDLSGGTGTGSSVGNAMSTAGSSTADDPGRKLVIEGNRAWTAACTVRKRWLADTLLARRTAPKQAMPFITAQLLIMPQPLRDALTRIPTSSLFHELTGGTMKAAETAAWAAGRLPLALLAVITAAYEDRMGGDGGRETWRTDRPYPRCPRDDAGTYFRFLAGVGYELSAIEQAVAEGSPYSGDDSEGEPNTRDDAPADASTEANPDEGIAQDTNRSAEAA